MKKSSLFILILMMSIKVGYSQNNRFIRNYRSIYFGDVYISPVGVRDFFNGSDIRNNYTQLIEYSFFTFIYNFRYNLYESSTDLSLGINAAPSLAITSSIIEGRGIGTFTLPLIATLDYGAGSTYSSIKNIGFFGGIGLEFVKLDLVRIDKVDPEIPREARLKTGWIQPVLQLGVRWWSKNDNLYEFAFKYGQKFGSTELDPNYESESWRDASTIQISIGKFLNY